MDHLIKLNSFYSGFHASVRVVRRIPTVTRWITPVDIRISNCRQGLKIDFTRRHAFITYLLTLTSST